MREAIEAVVADFQDRALPALTPREASLPEIPGKADAVIGMRRSGKSFFLFQQIQQLLERGVPRRRTLYVNLEDERLLPLKAQELGLIPESLYRRFPEVRSQTCWFFLDEVQNVPGWERFVRRLLDTENVRVVVSGSRRNFSAKRSRPVCEAEAWRPRSCLSASAKGCGTLA